MRSQKTALVTGANKGIGFEVARELARLGLRVFLGARNAEAGQAAAEKLKSTGDVAFLQIDVSKPESIRAAVEEISQHTDRLDVLINNAGLLLDEAKDDLSFTTDI